MASNNLNQIDDEDVSPKASSNTEAVGVGAAAAAGAVVGGTTASTVVVAAVHAVGFGTTGIASGTVATSIEILPLSALNIKAAF